MVPECQALPTWGQAEFDLLHFLSLWGLLTDTVSMNVRSVYSVRRGQHSLTRRTRIQPLLESFVTLTYPTSQESRWGPEAMLDV